MTHYDGLIAKVIFWVFCRKMARKWVKMGQNGSKMTQKWVNLVFFVIYSRKKLVNLCKTPILDVVGRHRFLYKSDPKSDQKVVKNT